MVNSSLETMLQLANPVARSFTTLNYDGHNISMRQLNLIGNLTALTRLALSLECFEMAEFSRALEQLHNLTQLRLSVNFVTRIADYGSEDEEEDEVDDDDRIQPVVLPSVTTLELSVWHCGHGDLATLSIGQVFPSVREVKMSFIADFCRVCRVAYLSKEELEMCTDALVLPLFGVDCPNVEKVVATHKLYEGFRKVYVK